MSRFFIDNSLYFITIPTYKHKPLFMGERKGYVLSRMNRACAKFDISNIDFSIMVDHYHVIANFKDASIIPKFLQYINGGSSYLLKCESDYNHKVWGEYHVYIAFEKEVYERIRGYVIGNPLKHNEIVNMSELVKYPYSSFSRVVEVCGKDYAEEIVSSVIQLNEDQFFDSLPVRPD